MTTPTTTDSKKSHVLAIFDTIGVLIIGLILLAAGLFVIVMTVRQAATTPGHDRQLLVGAGFAVLGALIMSPAAVGGALKSLGLTVSQMWPGGRRAGDPPTGGQ